MSSGWSISAGECYPASVSRFLFIYGNVLVDWVIGFWLPFLCLLLSSHCRIFWLYFFFSPCTFMTLWEGIFLVAIKASKRHICTLFCCTPVRAIFAGYTYIYTTCRFGCVTKSQFRQPRGGRQGSPPTLCVCVCVCWVCPSQVWRGFTAIIPLWNTAHFDENTLSQRCQAPCKPLTGQV